MSLDEIVQPGRELGPYRIEGLLGVGGLARVYSAKDLQLDRWVALKFLSDAIVGDAHLNARFISEAKIAAKLSHPAIVPVYSWEELAGRTCFAMELVEGGSLAQRFAEGSMDLTQLLKIFLAVVDALEYAWQRFGLVHRDVKPENILLTPEGRPKLADFGMAKVHQAPGDPGSITRTGVILGTPYYLSPEQVRSQPLDHRSDFYSLGVTLYQGVTGRVPFHSSSAMSVAVKHLEELPPSPSSWRSGIEPALESLILRLMAKDPDHRPRDHAELMEALRQVHERLKIRPHEKVAPSKVAAATQASGGQRASDTRALEPAPAPAHATEDSNGSPTLAVQPPPRPTPPWIWAVAGALASALMFTLTSPPRPLPVTEITPSSPPAASPAPPATLASLHGLWLPGWSARQIEVRERIVERLSVPEARDAIAWVHENEQDARRRAASIEGVLDGGDFQHTLASLRLRLALWKLFAYSDRYTRAAHSEARDVLTEGVHRLSRIILELLDNRWVSGLSELEYRQSKGILGAYRLRLARRGLARADLLQRLVTFLETTSPGLVGAPELAQAFPLPAPGPR